MLIKFLVRALKSAHVLICFGDINMKKPPSKVAYFRKIAEIFSSAKMAQFAQQQ